MTDHRIRHIIAGLKSEIIGETDQERKANLAIMGLCWNDVLGANIKTTNRKIIYARRGKKKANSYI